MTRRGQRPTWQWVALIIGGVGLLSLIAFFVGRSIVGSKTTTPSPVPTRVSAPTPTSAPTSLASPVGEEESTPQTKNPTLSPDIPSLQQLMLTLINEDRQENGLSELSWDSTAATVGLTHAQDMARFGFLSHLNLDGHGPDYRYSLAGGTNAIRENVYEYKHSPGNGPTTADEWQEIIRQAQDTLMKSQLHRDNILAPEHTQVGIGIAYEPESGRLTIAQEFVNRYLRIEPLPHRVSRGDLVTIAGQLEPGVTSPLLNLAYEPFPEPKSVTELNATGAFESPAEIYDAVPLDIHDGNAFEYSVALGNEEPSGLHHVRIWVDTSMGQVLTTDVVIEVH